MTSDERLKLLESTLKEVESLHECGILNTSSYNKCLIGLAYEYTFLNKIANGVDLLKRCGQDYLEKTFKDQSQEDYLFFKVIQGIKKKLLEFGIKDIEMFAFISKSGST